MKNFGAKKKNPASILKPKTQQKLLARRHRKVLRDNIQGITKPAIQRLVHAVAPEAQLSGLIYEVTRGILKCQLDSILCNAITFTEHNRHKTLTVRDVEMACEVAIVNMHKNTVVGAHRSDHAVALGGSESWKSYIYKVLKQVHPDTGMSELGMRAVESYVWELFTRLMRAAYLAKNSSGKATCSSREVQTAVRLVLPGELAKHAVSEGTKAVVKFTSGGGNYGYSMSKSARAGLQFPVGRIARYMKTGGTPKVHGFDRVSECASVYMASVLEYMTAELLELSGNAARDCKRVRITPKHIDLAIVHDSELAALNFGTYFTELILGDLPFQRVVREVASDYRTDLRFTADAIAQLQKLAELDLRSLFSHAFRIAQHAGRKTIGPRDLHIVRELGL